MVRVRQAQTGRPDAVKCGAAPPLRSTRGGLGSACREKLPLGRSATSITACSLVGTALKRGASSLIQRAYTAWRLAMPRVYARYAFDWATAGQNRRDAGRRHAASQASSSASSSVAHDGGQLQRVLRARHPLLQRDDGRVRLCVERGASLSSVLWASCARSACTSGHLLVRGLHDVQLHQPRPTAEPPRRSGRVSEAADRQRAVLDACVQAW